MNEESDDDRRTEPPTPDPQMELMVSIDQKLDKVLRMLAGTTEREQELDKRVRRLEDRFPENGHANG